LELFPLHFEKPFQLYIKLSEIIFINDFISNPEVLEKSLKKVNLLDDFSKQDKNYLKHLKKIQTKLEI